MPPTARSVDAMSAAQLLPVQKLSRVDGDSKAGGGSGIRSYSHPYTSPPGSGKWLMLTMKEYAAWHARISNLVFFFVLLATGAVLGVITTLNAVGYYGPNPETGFLSSSLTSLTPAVLPLSKLDAAADAPSSPAFNLRADDGFLQKADDSSRPAPDATSPDVVDLDDERKDVHRGNISDYLSPDPVDLAPLSDVYHGMSEAELLRRASMRPPAAIARPAAVTPKLAFLFLTRGPLPLAPLWERYFRGHRRLYSIYVHAHPRFRPNVSADSAFYRRNIPSEEVLWGQLSVFAAERRLLANALLDPANERFVLVSESCIPIAPLPVAYKYFMESEHSFVEAHVNRGKGGYGRYNRIRNRQKLNPEISLKQWRKGSQWFEMSRNLAVTVVSDRKYYPKFEHVFCTQNGICYIDEHYLPTVLTILAPTKLANRTTTFIDFSRSAAHPYQWEAGGINEARLKTITEGHNCTYNGKFTTTCHMFARKFSPGTLEPLLKLASKSFGIA